MNTFLTVFALAAAATAASATISSGSDGGRGPLACAGDFCPIYCGNVQPIDVLASDGDTQVRPLPPCAAHLTRAADPLPFSWCT